MCASYWNLIAQFTCPSCHESSDWELQTHFMGGVKGTMCMDYYNIGDKISPLGDMSVILNGKNDDFIGDCPKCGKYYDFGGQIVNGKVESVFILKHL